MEMLLMQSPMRPSFLLSSGTASFHWLSIVMLHKGCLCACNLMGMAICPDHVLSGCALTPLQNVAGIIQAQCSSLRLLSHPLRSVSMT